MTQDSRLRLDELANRLMRFLPRGSEQLGEDVRRNLRTLLQNAFERMELVTREEFDVQRALLARTRARVEALEQRVTELEAALQRDRDS